MIAGLALLVLGLGVTLLVLASGALRYEQPSMRARKSPAERKFDGALIPQPRRG
ncbi:hypothetical protein JOM49_001382 [Amycolatopsis magusensis]|uniref:Uncharacterized protein n=1 Tax=Amycolatopsis magusensis TaxID=882444 RepID=A0ABS4PKC0_9PSEU|nr:hypothetical protein [Amycolatopsis magusensis]